MVPSASAQNSASAAFVSVVPGPGRPGRGRWRRGASRAAVAVRDPKSVPPPISPSSSRIILPELSPADPIRPLVVLRGSAAGKDDDCGDFGDGPGAPPPEGGVTTRSYVIRRREAERRRLQSSGRMGTVRPAAGVAIPSLEDEDTLEEGGGDGQSDRGGGPDLGRAFSSLKDDIYGAIDYSAGKKKEEEKGKRGEKKRAASALPARIEALGEDEAAREVLRREIRIEGDKRRRKAIIGSKDALYRTVDAASKGIEIARSIPEMAEGIAGAASAVPAAAGKIAEDASSSAGKIRSSAEDIRSAADAAVENLRSLPRTIRVVTNATSARAEEVAGTVRDAYDGLYDAASDLGAVPYRPRPPPPPPPPPDATEVAIDVAGKVGTAALKAAGMVGVTALKGAAGLAGLGARAAWGAASRAAWRTVEEQIGRDKIGGAGGANIVDVENIDAEPERDISDSQMKKEKAEDANKTV